MQLVLAMMLRELGFKSRPALTLAAGDSRELVPDLCGFVGLEDNPYPRHGAAVVIEILSEEDRFSDVVETCRQYSAWGVQDVLLFDAASRQAWSYNGHSGDLIRLKESYRFRSRPMELVVKEVFRRFEAELG